MSRFSSTVTVQGRQGQEGTTLVELLVGMLIAAILSTLILGTWWALTQSYANTVRRGEATDFARLGLSRLEREIRDAQNPPPDVADVAVVRARPWYIVLYTTFNEAGNQSGSVAPRLVMYRLYSNGELWRFQDVNGDGVISGVDIGVDSWPGVTFNLAERTSGERAQLLASNLVNASVPSTANPTPLFTYLSYNPDGSLARASDVRGTNSRAQIKGVEINVLVDLNPGKSPVYTHLRTTAQIRNTR